MDQEQGSLAGVETVETDHGELTVNDHTAEIEAFSRDVRGLRTIMVNLFAVSDGAGWVLIDSGIPGSKSKIVHWVRDTQAAQPPQALLLTHGHFDHTGAVAELAREWNVPVYVHELELPFVTGKREYPAPDPSVGGGVMSLLSPMFSRKPIDLSDKVELLPPGGRVPGLPSWTWIHTPGHTDGHVSFFRESDGTLLAGDALTTTKQESFWAIMRQKGELHGPPAYFTSDWDAAERSVRKLAELRPRIIAAGHGKPVVGEAARDGLEELAANFQMLARPRK